MPFLLAFAAGAMLYVVVEELIPQAHLDVHADCGTLAVMGGFLIMMLLGRRTRIRKKRFSVLGREPFFLSV